MQQNSKPTSTDVGAEERFKASFNNAFVGIAHVGLDGRWQRVNRTLTDILGYDADELLETTFQQLTHPDDLQTDLDLLAQLNAGEIPNYRMEKRYLHKLGHVVWADLQVAPQRDDQGRILYYISSVLDITRTKRLETELRQLKEAVELEYRTYIRNLNLRLDMLSRSVYRLQSELADADLTDDARYALLEIVANIESLDQLVGRED